MVGMRLEWDGNGVKVSHGRQETVGDGNGVKVSHGSQEKRGNGNGVEERWE